MRRGGLKLHPERLFPLHLVRLWDHEVAELASFTRPVGEWQNLSRLEPPHGELASVFIAARAIFGRSCRRFDPHKSSFRFPLLLSATRDASPFRYLVTLEDLRGRTIVSYRRVEAMPAAPLVHRYREPVDEELSRNEMDYLGEFLCGYLTGFARAVCVDAPPFVRTIPSMHMLYGLCAGELFEYEASSAADFEQRVAAARAECSPASDLADVTNLMNDIVAEAAP